MPKHVTGDRKLNTFLNNLEKKVPKNASRTALAKSARVLVRATKNLIPSEYPDIKKAIGWRRVKQKGAGSRGRYQAKLGAAVGIKESVRLRIAKEKREENKKKEKKGVGISANNVHWTILGTTERTIAEGPEGSGWPPPGWETGKMPKMFENLIERGVANGEKVLIDKLRPAVLAEIKRTRR